MTLPGASSHLAGPARGRELLIELVRRQLKLAYKEPALGVLWAIIAPLAQLAVFYWLFNVLFNGAFPNFAAFIFVGLMAWSWFQGSVGQGTSAIVNNRSLIQQPRFPVVILPLVVVAAKFVEFLVAMPILLIFLALNGVPLSWAMLTLPIVILVQATLISAAIYPLAALNVRFRDTQFLVGAGLGAMFFLSGIFYDAHQLAQNYRFTFLFNPMVYLVQAYRSILLEGTLPEWLPLLLVFVLSALCLPLGFSRFKRNSTRFLADL